MGVFAGGEPRAQELPAGLFERRPQRNVNATIAWEVDLLNAVTLSIDEIAALSVEGVLHDVEPPHTNARGVMRWCVVIEHLPTWIVAPKDTDKRLNPIVVDRCARLLKTSLMQ